jgi:hypothetical protein
LTLLSSGVVFLRLSKICISSPQVLATSLPHAAIAVDEFLFRFDP